MIVSTIRWSDASHVRSQAENRHPHPGQQQAAQGRRGEAEDLRFRVRRGRSHHRGVPADGARQRVRHLRDGDHDLYLRQGARQADDGGADLPGARVPPRRDPRQYQGGAFAEGARRQEGRRQPRLHRHHRRLGAGHFAGRARCRSLQDHLGAVRRRARRRIQGAEERGADREGQGYGRDARLR